jgi:hypothetical protein
MKEWNIRRYKVFGIIQILVSLTGMIKPIKDIIGVTLE